MPLNTAIGLFFLFVRLNNEDGISGLRRLPLVPLTRSVMAGHITTPTADISSKRRIPVEAW
jgi:hypothetical protein